MLSDNRLDSLYRPTVGNGNGSHDGNGDGGSGPTLLPDRAPRTMAQAFIDNRWQDGVHYRGDYYTRRPAVYEIAEREVLRADVSNFLDVLRMSTDEGSKPLQPDKRMIDEVVYAISNLRQARVGSMPAWLDNDASRPAPSHVMAFENGLLDVQAYIDGEVRLIPPTAAWFSVNVLPFRFDPGAPEPKRWHDFLCSLWPDDPEPIDLLREWFGYALTQDTRQQKILMMLGPKRSGKGTIAFILTRLIGPSNIAGPTLSGLATQFGVSPLLGKQLAIISDARLGNHTDQAVVVERLLTISGEDWIDVDRKNRELMTVRLPTKLMILSNELPKFADASGALADRFIVIPLSISFLGKEDTKLRENLSEELPGILLWALEGLRRLHRRGHFKQTNSGREILHELHDLVSPVHAFVRERCIVGPGREVSIKELWEAWQSWCRDQGRDYRGHQSSLGRDLRAAVPGLKTKQVRDGEERNRVYTGIGLG